MNASLQNKISAIRGKKSFLRNWELLVELLKIQLNFKQNNSFLIRLWFFLEFLIKKIIYVDILSLFSVLAVSTIFMSAFCVLYAVAQYFMKDLSYLVPIINRLTLIAFPLFYGPEKIPVKFQFLYLHIPPIWMIAKTKDIVGDSLTVPSFVTFDVTCISILFLLIVFFFLQFYFESLVKNKV